jgi:hypothetical protein
MPGPASNIDRPAVRLRDGERPWQSESNALVRFVWVVCPNVEAFEQVHLVFQWDPRPVVGNRPTDHAICRTVEAHGDPASVRREMLSIGDEVEERPVETRAVAEHAGGGTSRHV